MAINGYLAMTAAEFRENPPENSKIAWMACHFSPYGTGLSNRPARLPEGSMVILNDRTPICGHDHGLILNQLRQLVEDNPCSAVLLDFQRPDVAELRELTGLLQEGLPCPTAVSDLYAADPAYPVFLPPVPPDLTLEAYLQPWNDREIWLEAARSACNIVLSEHGAESAEVPIAEACKEDRRDEELCCHYRISVADRVIFSLYRTEEDLRQLMTRAEQMGVTRAVGLYQELGPMRL